MRKRLVAVIVLALALLGGGMSTQKASAEDQVDLLLVLAADISRSLDTTKFKLQREGYAAALTNPKVIAAINSVPTGRIAICFVEWSGANAQAVVVDWTSVGGAPEAEALADRILAAPRLFMERTAIGSAIEYSMAQFGRSPFKAERRVIDVSGDGTSNAGVEVTVARDKAVDEGITVNGLAILSEVPLASNPTHTHPPGGLLKYYEDNVIGGQGAFALSAENFEAFGRSILNKLIKEIAAAPDAAGSLMGRP
jgi:hypothetical protein